MNLEAKTVMILGGSGLVGRAVARQVLARGPATLVLLALTEREVREAVEGLEGGPGGPRVEPAWGNIFYPAAIADRPAAEVLTDEGLRDALIRDILGDLTNDVLERSFLYQLLQRYRPEAVIDCINTATAFAYQDVFHSAQQLLGAARVATVTRDAVERHILTLAVPQLIRHVQIALEGMRRAGTVAYVKIGTSGSGGMGFNVPYTHSEERPSRTLMAKSALAGAQSLLLFLMARTPDGPAVIEIKPTAAIAWRRIAFGPVRRAGKAIPLFDCREPLALEHAFDPGASGWVDLERPLESVFIDVGENGVFAREEFATVSALGQMEFITPEEVAAYVAMELEGRPTGRDVVAAYDAATAGPTYRAGVLREPALRRLGALEVEHGVRSIAFEMLGPPRLSKMLYESHICSRLRATVADLARSDPGVLSAEAVELVASDAELRAAIISIGLPILLPGGKVYRAATVIIGPPPGTAAADTLAARGWVDLRPSSCQTWIKRAKRMVREAASGDAARSGSDVDWHAVRPDDPIVPSRFAAWVFRVEDGGDRVKR